MLGGRRPRASILICQGCCCGHPEKGNPAIPRGELEAVWRTTQLEEAVRLRFVDCIGPCEPANLAVIKTPAENIWLAGLDGAQAYDALAVWAEQSRDAGEPAPLSEVLASHQIPAPRDDLPE